MSRALRLPTGWSLTDEEIQLYRLHLARVEEEVSIQPLPPTIQDHENQAVIETAAAGAVDVICTFDAHFYKPPVLAFCAARLNPGYG